MVAKKYIPEIDICKGIAILLVLLSHSFLIYPINMKEIPLHDNVGHWFSPFFLCVFFVVSGALFGQSNKVLSFKDVIWSKFKRLLIPFFTYEILNLGLKLALPSLVNRKVESFGAYFDKLLLHGGELWFVYVLFFIFVIWSYVLPRLDKKYVWMLLALVYILSLTHVALPGDIFESAKIIFYSQWFLLGYLVDLELIRGGYCKWLKISILAAFVVLNLFLYDTFIIAQQWLYLYTILGCLVCFVVSNSIVNTWTGKSLGYVGKYSLQFYVLNGFALVPARTIIVKVLGMSEPWQILVTVFVLCVVFELLMIEVIKRIPYVRYCFGIVVRKQNNDRITKISD